MMRHLKVSSPILRSVLKTIPLALTSALVFGPQSSFATPVYLRMESRFPSGHHPRAWLEGKTKKLQFQRWLRVETKDHIFGWAPEDSLVTPMSLALEATLLETAPVRQDSHMDAIVGRETIAKGTRVLLIESQGAWIRARLVGGVSDSWFPMDVLKPVVSAKAKAFIPKEAPVYVLPGDKARVQYKARASMFAQILSEQNGWLEIRSPFGPGFIRKTDAVTFSDLGETGARPLTDLVPMRSAPLPYADVTRNLPRGSVLTVLAEQTLRWGQTRVPEVGEVWWPITDDAEEEKDPSLSEKLTTAEVFKRKIFDMASSPAIPSLKFVSAQGIYRTVDGTEWTKIPVFQDKNYPIAISGGGAIFVGPYVSDDHGETFAQWIRWDTLVGTLRKFSRRAPQRLQIQEIRPEDPAGRRVMLKLSVGQEALVKLVTDDQGKSWRPL